jgi:AAA+ superfamily predicted ATPase
MNPDLLFHLRTLTRFIYYVTEEEDVFLTKFSEALKRHQDQTYVFNSTLGLLPLNRLIADWSNRGHQANRECQDIHNALIKIYQDEPPGEGQNFYIITDPERYLPDTQVQRRILNIAHQLHADDRIIKIVIFVSNRLVIPQKLQRYIEVIHDLGMTEEEIGTLLDKVCGNLQIEPPKNIVRSFKGLTSFEADAAIAHSIITTKYDSNNPKRIDAKVIGEFKRRQLAKTDLINFVDVNEFTFDVVGGNDRFKEWAGKTKASWTDAGQEYGLIPPKGVLAVGVWGCGKSLSVKAMGHAWKLPVIQLEMGRLRSSAVGETEANVYRAISLIESVAPCVVWIDEAEKSLSGGQSSAMSDAGTTSRTIGILSNWLQETTSQVCLAMTANSLKTLPVEFVNRMDERFFFDLPSDDERVAILKIHLIKRGQDPSRFQLANLAEKAINMVGREIEQAIGAALIESFDAGHEALDQDILAEQLQGKPRIFKTMVDELKEVLEWVGYDPDVDDGIRARFASAKRSETFTKFRGSGS